MRHLRAFIIGLLALFIVATLFSLVLPSKPRISRASNMPGTADSVFSRAGDLRNWYNWYQPIAQSGINPVFSPSTTGSGAWMKLNDRSLRMVHCDSGSIRVRVEAPGQTEMEMVMNVQPLGGRTDSCVVQWYVEREVGWLPWQKFATILYDNMLGPDLEKSLTQMKLQISDSSRLK